MSQEIDARTTAGYSDGVRSATVQTAIAAGPVRVAVVIVVSPSEPAIALDSLIRAAALSPFHTTFFLADNTGDPSSLAGFPSQLDRRLVVLPVSNAPRPYFEIGRTVFSLLSQVAPLAPQIVIKIDPDTVVLSPLFFLDLIDALDTGDFAAA